MEWHVASVDRAGPYRIREDADSSKRIRVGVTDGRLFADRPPGGRER
jgi:hypothetical protein